MKFILPITILLVVYCFLFAIPAYYQQVLGVTLQQGLPEGTPVNLTDYFLPNPGKTAHISNGETFWIEPGQNDEYIQCTNDLCTNFQKIFITADGFAIQGENHWNNVENTTFQYRQGTFNWSNPNINPEQYPQATWLPSNMRVGETHDSGPITVVGFYISPDPYEGITARCDSACNNTGAGNTHVGTKLTYVGPVDFGNNILLDDVAIVDVVYGPGQGEKFYFANEVGWVGWENNGTRNLIGQPLDGIQPTSTRIPTPAAPPGCPDYTCRYSENIAPEDALQCSTNVRWVYGNGCDGDNCAGCQYLGPDCSTVECFVPEPTAPLLTKAPPQQRRLTPTPKKETPDEIAMKKKNIVVPSELTSTIRNRDVGFFGNLLNSLLALLGFTPTFPETFSSRSQVQQQSFVPQELEPLPAARDQKLKSLLDKVYRSSLPFNDSDFDKSQKLEKAYERANFPEGIQPITGSTSSILK